MKEIWKDVVGYEGLYQVSDKGQVKSLRRNKILSPINNGKNYMAVILTKNGQNKYCKIHRLVVEAFIPNPNNLPQVNHKDENKQNNCVDNLEWCSVEYNNQYSHNKAIFQKNIKNEIIKKWESITIASKTLNIQRSNINSVCLGKRQFAGGYKWEYAKEE